MKWKYIYLLFILLLPTTSFSSESFVGNYSRIPNGDVIIKVTKIEKSYFIQFSSNALKELPGLIKKQPQNEVWSNNDKGMNFKRTYQLKSWYGENWNTKLDSMLYFEKSGIHLLKLKDNYSLDENLYAHKNIIYTRHKSLLLSNKNPKYVFGFMYWYFDVFKLL